MLVQRVAEMSVILVDGLKYVIDSECLVVDWQARQRPAGTGYVAAYGVSVTATTLVDGL